jgi:hypothetical protein
MHVPKLDLEFWYSKLPAPDREQTLYRIAAAAPVAIRNTQSAFLDALCKFFETSLELDMGGKQSAFHGSNGDFIGFRNFLVDHVTKVAFCELPRCWSNQVATG